MRCCIGADAPQGYGDFCLMGNDGPSLIILYSVRSRTQAIGNIAKCSTEHNLLFFGETTYTTISINTIELMIKP